MAPTRDDDAGGLTPAQWTRLEALLADALELPNGSRTDFVDREASDDPALRAELHALLLAHDEPGILDTPPSPWEGAGTVHTEGEFVGGDVIAHYEIERHLGSGGMGHVYRARDLRLERTVALKFLPTELGRDAQAKRRFLTEAKAAAALDHPNVCAIHEIGETANGQLFIAMAFIDGETLRDAIGRGPFPPQRAAEIAGQLTAALQSAHQRGIVHRDVKPANVMLGADGIVKLLDFGIAKLEGSTQTGAGVTPGTTAYMSPEQVRGENVDHRTDLWASGVVLYEMLTGKRPFAGPSDAATLHAILAVTPTRLSALQPGLPAAFDGLLARALAKDRERRFQSAAEMQAAIQLASAEASPLRPTLSRRRLLLTAAAGVVMIAGTWYVASGPLATRRAVNNLERSQQLAARAEYAEAYTLAASAERVLGNDTTLAQLMPVVADRLTILSEPEGAEVWMQRIGDDGALTADSVRLGVTPLRDLRVARADYRIDIRKAGFAPVARIASSALNRAEFSLGVRPEVVLDVEMQPEGSVPHGMVLVSGGGYMLVGREVPNRDTVALAPFYMDAHEVTNQEFHQFVVAGGYSDLRWWRHPFVVDRDTISWKEAMTRLVDRTGLPGPRGWTGQEFPAGESRHPVTGVTWYEAAAYAAFAGKRLPSIFEWEKAARDGRYTHFEHIVMPWGLADPSRGVARRANFSSAGPETVGSHPSGISAFGAYDMAGNVEEWVANRAGLDRWVTGGAWDDPMYVFTRSLSVPGFHSSPSLGFRCARDVNGASATSGLIDIPPLATPRYHPVDDGTYRTLLRHYAYDKTSLDAVVVSSDITEDWTRETIRIAGPWPDPTVLYLYTPHRAQRPVQTVVYVPGTNTFFLAALAEDTERLMGPHIKAGRAVLTVLMHGMLGRPWEQGRVSVDPRSVQHRREVVMHSIEMRRGMDYLETRPDIDTSRLAYLGFSKGSGSWLAFAAIEDRFKSVVLMGGGLDERFLPSAAEVNSINFASRIKAPKLLINGRYDEEHPWQMRGLPLWSLLREPKRLELVEGGHLPRAEARVPVINSWLDETLGPVRQAASK